MTHTSHIFTTSLSPSQEACLKQLVSLCVKKDSLTLSCPLDAGLFWLAFSGEQLVSCLAAYELKEDVWECCGFTHPEFRHQGFFSGLLDEACKSGGALEEADLYFAVDGHCPEALQVLAHLEAEHAYDEFMMEYTLKPVKETAFPSFPDFSLSIEKAVSEGNAGQAHGFFQGLPAGSCFLAPQKSRIYLYGLEILQHLRGQGLGSRFMQLLIPELGNMGFHTLKLQVSGENTAALSLYKKTGFCITQTLSYFLY